MRMRKLAAVLVGLMMVGTVGTGLAQPMKGMERMKGMGPKAGVASRSPEDREPTEHGTKQADGLEVTLVSAPPLSPAEMQRMMPGMGGMGSMQGRGGMMRDMPGMGGMAGAGVKPTHWIGVIVSNVKEGRVVPDLQITLTARKGELTWTVSLMPMPGSYGANISLPEKGRYTVTVTVAHPERPVSVAFDFEYR